MMKVTVAKINNRGQVVLPKDVREALRVKPGDEVLFIVEGNIVKILARPESYTEYMYGLGQQIWEALGGGDNFLARERASWE